MEELMEEELKKLGFKKRWFEDKSGCWLIKIFTFKGIQMRLYVEVDNRLLFTEIKTGDYFNNKLSLNKCYDPISKHKLTLENVRMLIKKYK